MKTKMKILLILLSGLNYYDVSLNGYHYEMVLTMYLYVMFCLKLTLYCGPDHGASTCNPHSCWFKHILLVNTKGLGMAKL